MAALGGGARPGLGVLGVRDHAEQPEPHGVCQHLERTREVSRIPQEVDDCELAMEHRQYLLERQAEIE